MVTVGVRSEADTRITILGRAPKQRVTSPHTAQTLPRLFASALSAQLAGMHSSDVIVSLGNDMFRL